MQYLFRQYDFGRSFRDCGINDGFNVEKISYQLVLSAILQ